MYVPDACRGAMGNDSQWVKPVASVFLIFARIFDIFFFTSVYFHHATLSLNSFYCSRPSRLTVITEKSKRVLQIVNILADILRR